VILVGASTAEEEAVGKHGNQQVQYSLLLQLLEALKVRGRSSSTRCGVDNEYNLHQTRARGGVTAMRRTTVAQHLMLTFDFNKLKSYSWPSNVVASRL